MGLGALGHGNLLLLLLLRSVHYIRTITRQSPIVLYDALLLTAVCSEFGVCRLHGSANYKFILNIIDILKQAVGRMQFGDQEMELGMHAATGE